MEEKKKIKLFVMDVDGTLTDGTINISKEGEIFKSFNVKDGYGIANILPHNGITTAIITGRQSKIVEERAKELKINELHQGVVDKVAVLKKVMKKYNCEIENVAYIGDDINDLDCISSVGVSACPSDAVPQVVDSVNFVCKLEGGKGAVREFIDFLEIE